MPLTIKFSIKGDSFEASGDLTIDQALPLVDKWFGAIGNPAALHAAVTQLGQEGATLQAAVDAQPT